jgi:hypothetical protein
MNLLLDYMMQNSRQIFNAVTKSAAVGLAMFQFNSEINLK